MILALGYASHHKKVMPDRIHEQEHVTPVNEEYISTRVDYRQQLDPWRIYNQGECGNCWAMAMTTALQATAQIRQNLDQVISPGFLTAALTYGDAYYNLRGCNGGWLKDSADELTGKPNAGASVCNFNNMPTNNPSYCGNDANGDVSTLWSSDGLVNDSTGQSTCTTMTPVGCTDTSCNVPIAEDCGIPLNYTGQGTLQFESLNSTFFSGHDCTHGASNANQRNCPQLMTYLLHEFGPIATNVGVYPVNGSVLASNVGGWATGGDLTAHCQTYAGKSYEGSSNHAVTIVGDRTHNGRPQWIIQNSWVSEWGDGGYFYIDKGHNYCSIETEFAVFNEVHLTGKTKFAPAINLTFAKAFRDTWPKNANVWPDTPTPTPTPAPKATEAVKWYVYVAIGLGTLVIVALVMIGVKTLLKPKKTLATIEPIAPLAQKPTNKLRL